VTGPQDGDPMRQPGHAGRSDGETAPGVESRELPTRVAMDELHPSESLRMGGVNEEHVLALVESAADLPPILVHRATMRVIDGLHRIRAARLRGDDAIEVRYFDGSEDDAFVLGVRENIAHGLPLSLADRRVAAGRILLLRPQWSDRAIAAAAGLSPKTVGALRRERAGDLDPAQVRAGRDGRLRPVNSTEVRELAGRYLAQHPDARPSEVAQATGVSLRTARDLRSRIDREKKSVHAAPPPARRPEGRPTDAAPQDSREDVAHILRVLRSDPSLRFTESGRVLIRAFEAQAVCASNVEQLLDNLPSHCMTLVMNMARVCAGTWREFAEGVEARERDLRSAAGESA
jgi:ParB-like chromosome segregation protein Spo0J